MNMHHNHTIVC